MLAGFPKIPLASEGVGLLVGEVDPLARSLGAEDSDAGLNVRQPVGIGGARLALGILAGAENFSSQAGPKAAA